MGKRIAVTIQKIPISKVNSYASQQTTPVSKYLKNIDDTNIESGFESGESYLTAYKVYIKNENFETSENIDIAEGYYEVFDATTNPYVKVKGTKYFIPQKATLSQNASPDSNIITYTFYVNPSRITPTYRKLQTEQRTLGGW